MAKYEIAKAANFLDLIRAQVPDVDGARFPLELGSDDHLILDNRIMKVQSRNPLIESLYCVHSVPCCQSKKAIEGMTMRSIKCSDNG